MYDLHTHSLLSDGALLPSEVAVRYLAAGYKVIAISDHSDYSNIEFNIEAILKFTKHWPKSAKITVLPGIELTHLPLEQFKPLAKFARSKGIKVIIGHGETLAEPVLKGTNLAALNSDIDILAHPGLITDEETRLAAKRGIFLEVTTRSGHRDTNAHVIEQALKFGAKLAINNDSHNPEDVLTPEQLKDFAKKAGLDLKHINKVYSDLARFLK